MEREGEQRQRGHHRGQRRQRRHSAQGRQLCDDAGGDGRRGWHKNAALPGGRFSCTDWNHVLLVLVGLLPLDDHLRHI